MRPRVFSGQVMHPRRKERLLRGLVRFVPALLAAAIAGGVLGFAISELTGSDGGPDGVNEAATTTDSPGSAPPIRARVVTAVLHPAATPSGKRRQRARLGVRINVENTGAERVSLEPPSLLAARQRIPTGTKLQPIAAGKSLDTTVRFETAGAVTRQLTTQKRARIHVGGRSWPLTVKVGSPAHSSKRSGAAS
jgi:hypothetical protein